MLSKSFVTIETWKYLTPPKNNKLHVVLTQNCVPVPG